MTARTRRNRAEVALVAACLLALVPAAQGQTVCDTDPDAVDFEATLDPTALNKLLARLGTIDVPSPDAALTLGGVCVDHRIPITLNVVSLPVGTSPFTVETAPGSVEVQLDVPGPFAVGVDGGNYQAVNCDSSCVIEVPYLGELVNGCDVEAALVGPIVGVLDVGASWDDVRVTQVADTCVLGDCSAVHPVASTSVSLLGFDIDATGLGSCEICLPLPPPLDACVDPCDGIDPLLSSLVRAELEEALEGAFVNNQGEGTLIKVFSRQIVKDGCADIPEVRDCKANQSSVDTAGLLRSPDDRGLNGALYTLPFMVAVGLTLRFRRRGTPGGGR